MLLRSSLLDYNVSSGHEAMDFLSQIDQATVQLTEMVNNITSLYNLETGRTQLLLERKDVLEIVRSVAEKHKEWARKKAIQICFHLPDHPLYVTCDPIEVNRILTNLVNNAVKFTPEGGQITISAENAPASLAGRQPVPDSIS